MSGAVKSSDAEQLWTESRSIREWSTDRIAQLTGIISALESRVQAVEDRNKSLLEEKFDLLETIHNLRKELSECEVSINSFTEQLSISRKRVEILEAEAEALKGGK